MAHFLPNAPATRAHALSRPRVMSLAKTDVTFFHIASRKFLAGPGSIRAEDLKGWSYELKTPHLYSLACLLVPYADFLSGTGPSTPA